MRYIIYHQSPGNDHKFLTEAVNGTIFSAIARNDIKWFKSSEDASIYMNSKWYNDGWLFIMSEDEYDIIHLMNC